MKALLLLTILVAQLFVTTLCIDCREGCKECKWLLGIAKKEIRKGKAKQVEKDMRAITCGADPTTPEYACYVNPCTGVRSIMNKLMAGVPTVDICRAYDFC